MFGVQGTYSFRREYGNLVSGIRRGDVENLHFPVFSTLRRVSLLFLPKGSRDPSLEPVTGEVVRSHKNKGRRYGNTKKSLTCDFKIKEDLKPGVKTSPSPTLKRMREDITLKIKIKDK